MNCGGDGARGFSLCTYFCIPLNPLLYVNQPKALVATEANEVRTVQTVI
jgi:hypothetical protein